MPKDPDKIREQIASLRSELKDAERAQEAKQKKKIARAAERAGLHKIDVTSKALESELRSLAQRLSSATTPSSRDPQTTSDSQSNPDRTNPDSDTGPRY